MGLGATACGGGGAGGEGVVFTGGGGKGGGGGAGGAGGCCWLLLTYCLTLMFEVAMLFEFGGVGGAAWWACICSSHSVPQLCKSKKDTN